jgi:hypothetical protein
LYRKRLNRTDGDKWVTSKLERRLQHEADALMAIKVIIIVSKPLMLKDFINHSLSLSAKYWDWKRQIGDFMIIPQYSLCDKILVVNNTFGLL